MADYDPTRVDDRYIVDVLQAAWNQQTLAAGVAAGRGRDIVAMLCARHYIETVDDRGAHQSSTTAVWNTDADRQTRLHLRLLPDGLALLQEAGR